MVTQALSSLAATAKTIPAIRPSIPRLRLRSCPNRKDVTPVTAIPVTARITPVRWALAKRCAVRDPLARIALNVYPWGIPNIDQH